MTTMQCSKESMKYWGKLEPTDENVSRLFYFHKESELLSFKKLSFRNEEGNILVNHLGVK